MDSKRKVPGKIEYGIGYGPDITHIPKQKMGERGYKFDMADKDHTSFDHPKTRTDVMTKVQQLCWMVDGYGSVDDVEKRIGSFEASDLREAFGLALMEMVGPDDPMSVLIDKASGHRFGISVSENDYYDLRNSEMHTTSCNSSLADPLTLKLTKEELLAILNWY